MNINEFKAGKYEEQYEYQSFLPTPINQEWMVSDSKVLTLLEHFAFSWNLQGFPTDQE